MKSILSTLFLLIALTLAAPIHQLNEITARGDTDPVMATEDGTAVPFDPSGIVRNGN
ncbi:MAG: hypothetical protein M1812_000240 [Candelaria pacifica]|nr:MAG: hypothetical protein M1812_000240 [Candelaria pacifica]